MSPQIYLLLILSTTTNVLIAQIVDYGFGRRPELMPNNGIKNNMVFPKSVPQYNQGHVTTGINKIIVPFVWYQVPPENVNNRYLNDFLGKLPNKVHKQHAPSNADILRGMYSGSSPPNRRQGYVDYNIPYNPLIYNVPSIPSTIPKMHTNNLRTFARIVPDSVQIDNQFGRNEVKKRYPIESSILRRPESTLSDSDKKTDVIYYNNNNRQFDFVQHAIEKMLLPKKPNSAEKEIIENYINIHLKQHKPSEEVISTTEDIIMTSVDYKFVTPQSVKPETDVSIYIVDGVPFYNRRKMVSDQTEKADLTTYIGTENIVGIKPCCLLSNEENSIPEHDVAKDKLLKVISTTKDGVVGSNVSNVTPNKSAINITTEPFIINGKFTTPIKKISATIESIEQTEKRELTMEVTATEAYTEIFPKHEIGLDKMDESVTNTIEDSRVMTTPTLNQHSSDETIESKDRTGNVEPYKNTVKETIPDLVTSWTKQNLGETITAGTNTIEDNVAYNFSTTDNASSTPHSKYSSPLGAVTEGNTNDGEIHLTDDGEKSSLPLKTRAQTFLNSVEHLERRFHESNFNILSNLAPEERRENGISFLQSGLLLLVSLTALSTTVDEPTREEIANITLYAGTDQENADTIRNVLEGLPKTNSNLTIRWSNRLVLAPGYNFSKAFWRDSAENTKIHVDFLNDTSDPAVLAKNLNHMVEIDSGGAMRDDTFYEDELTSNVRCVLLSTLYFRARWRVGPTLLNGTRRFYDTTGDERTTPMVRINDVVRYASVERWDADAVEIPYATAGLTLLILVPRGRSVRALTGHVADEGLRNVLDSMATRRIAVTLPVYTLRMSLLLPNKLLSMGVKRLTEGMDQQIRLSHAIQRIMYWSEAGRNAFKDDGLEWDDIPEMELMVDRPYLFFVRWQNITLLNGNFVL